MAVALAVINKDNSPLYLRTVADPLDAELSHKLMYMLHTSLDVVEEKINSPVPGKNDARDLCLGVLYSLDEYKLYGYVTNTKVKMVIVVELSAAVQFRDNDLRNWFGRLHNAYSELVCNPFYVAGEHITSKKFESVVNDIMRK
ncbi:trafficking protein particle complex subunit 2 protein-like [Tropilaelaps mercedesae]|uniref:Trafficking protein particle complex subunit 2-like protein n=1 Tax=Tropilaelaps mercedesae TaxID=418985 RepID=A0A1V9XK70_9ACAR|nr:trafficking protein particle complex subunit 2 protein-like [Tropilaelaps mercedesae]